MRIRLLAFARVRDVLGTGSRTVDVAHGSTANDLWDELCSQCEALGALSASTRFALNGRIAAPHEMLEEGDEVALLPPFGGG